jgi:hypothetical protein
MSEDSIDRIRALYEERVNDKPVIHKWGGFDRSFVGELLQEVDLLRTRVSSLEHDLVVQKQLLEGEAAELRRLRYLELRVQDGRLTEAEFQAVCHNLSPEDEVRFKRGCYDEWRRLFGNTDLPPA